MKNLKGASKRAIYKSNVSKLDSFGIDKAEFFDKEALTAIEQVCGDFINRVIENINKADIVVTGSITNIELETKDNALNITAPSHLVYQSRGVNGAKNNKWDTPHRFGGPKGKGPSFSEFVEAIKEWIVRKNINLRDNEKYSGKETPFKNTASDQNLLDKAAYAITKSIYNEGIEPKNLYEKEIPKLIEDIQNIVSDFSVQFINQVIDIKPKGGGGKRIILK